ncbi:MAG: hypothetical protein N4A33_01255 [Bacteriovoracaceae bacterium]|jgi:hypothetical protein|nr:hypothetical protein [Bacteriovoracaceae bacterium]
MKKMNLLLLLLSLVLSTFAIASVVEQETFLSNHLTDVLKSYDERGVVRVDLEMKNKRLELPGTNFIVSSNIIGNLDKKNVKSLTVNVFSELKELPKEFKDYITDKTKKIATNPKIKFVQLEKRVNGFEQTIASGIEKISAKTGGDKNLIYVLIAIPVTILLIALFFRSQLKSSTTAMSNQLQGLTAALQEQGIGTSMEALNVEGTSSGSNGSDGGSTILEQSMWEAMNKEFYIGLLSDCYWCEEDAYASFVWSKVPVEMKRYLLDDSVIDEEYTRHISKIAPQDKGFGQNPYYLNPWPYEKMSNEDLGKLVSEDKRLFSYISPMRLTKIELTLEEKLECIAQASTNAMKEELFLSKIENQGESQRRYFDTIGEFDFGSFEEEDQLLGMDVEFSIMKKFPSLGWILKLDDEKIIEILSSYQAKELATALFVSDSTKEKILSKMPEKRRELIDSYAQKTKAVKNNVFKSIVSRVYLELEATVGKSDENAEKQSA